MLMILLLILLIYKIDFSIAQGCITKDNLQGECKDVDQCSLLIEEYYYQTQKIPGGIAFDTFIKNSYCKDGNKDGKICCPVRSLGSDRTTSSGSKWAAEQQPMVWPVSNEIFWNSPISVLSFKPISDNTNYQPPSSGSPPPKSNLFPNEGQCGRSTIGQNRIIGGNAAKKGAYPWLTALGYILSGAKVFLCAGSLITIDHVLTSAHCVTSELTFVRLGAHLLNTPDENTIDLNIKQKIIHNQYNSNLISYDIAILKLERSVTINSRIQLICLPFNIQLTDAELIGKNPFIAGWGTTKFQGSISNVLHEAQVPIVDTKQCRLNYTIKFRHVDITEKVICAGVGIADACQGDSGGPLMLPQLTSDKRSYSYYLIGLVSYGFECAIPGFPGVYTRITSHLSWIQNNAK